MTDPNAPTRLIGRSGRPSSATRRRRKDVSVTPYDFRRPINLSREKARMLEICFDAFGRQAATVLTPALRSVSPVELVSVEQVSYAEYVDTLEPLTYLTLFSVEPVPQPAVLETPLEVTMTCIDTLLGGQGSNEQPVRPLTDLESAVVSRLYHRLVAEVRPAFESLVAVEPVLLGVEYDAQLAQVAGTSDPMVVARFQLRLHEREYPLSVAMSFAGLVPYLNAAESADVANERDGARRRIAAERLRAGIQEVPVEVSVRLRATRVDPVELLGLAVGDVVRLQHPAEAPLDVTAADVVFGHATPGSQGQRLAALVVP